MEPPIIDSNVESTTPPTRKINNKIIISLILLILAGVASWVALYLDSKTPTQNSQMIIGWKTYTNTEYGFSLKYPSDWKLVSKNYLTNIGGTNEIMRLIYVGPKQGDNDEMLDAATITVMITGTDGIVSSWDYKNTDQHTGKTPLKDFSLEEWQQQPPFGYEGEIKMLIMQDGFKGTIWKDSVSEHGSLGRFLPSGRALLIDWYRVNYFLSNNFSYSTYLLPLLGTFKFNQPTATSTVDNTNWKTYVNTGYGFEIKYPQDFLVDDYAGSPGGTITPDHKWAYVADFYDKPNDGVSIRVNDVSDNLPSSLEKYVRKDQELKGERIKTIKHLSIGTKEGIEVVGEYDLEDALGVFQYKVIYIQNNSFIYTFMCDPTNEKVYAMLSTLKFIEPTATSSINMQSQKIYQDNGYSPEAPTLFPGLDWQEKTTDSKNMIEIGSNEVSEETVMEAMELAKTELSKIQKFQEKIITEIGKNKVKIPKPEISEKITNLFNEKISPIFMEKVFSGKPGKEDLSELVNLWKKEIETLENDNEKILAEDFLQEKIDLVIHDEIINNKNRPDKRKVDELRPLFAKAGGLSKILHGSGIFYRGGTHVLSVLTLGSPGDAQLIDTMETQDANKRFMLHYNFPPYSVGEVGRMGGTNRRMVGHGALAEKALVPVLPKKEIFPYTIRLVAESMASNGSTSMASVCAGTIALMDGGVPIARPVAGIASGLMMRDEDNYVILTDIQGPEDHHGDMDFKVAGTEVGITAVQMDVKVGGIPLHILKEAFGKAKEARMKILKVMTTEISAPRPNISEFAPHIISIKIKPDQIGLVIGTGGKTIKEIKEVTGADIDIEDDGTVYITGKGDGAERAQKIIENMTYEPKVGEKFRAQVVKTTEFGAFVRLAGTEVEGLVHISEICPRRLKTVEEVIKVGDIVPVVLKEVDDRGRLKLSIKDVDPEWFDKVK